MRGWLGVALAVVIAAPLWFGVWLLKAPPQSPVVTSGDAVAEKRFAGRVLSPEGLPMNRVAVRLVSQRLWEQAVEHSVDRSGQRVGLFTPHGAPHQLVVQGTIRELMTDASGAFAFDGVPNEPHYLRAWKPGVILDEETVAAFLSEPIDPMDTITLIARRRFSLGLDVVFPDGETREPLTFQCEDLATDSPRFETLLPIGAGVPRRW